MARNKHPEETVQRILDVAHELFSTKGYANVTIQEIVDNLGGLTKGAVYHHFKNKSEIFNATFDRERRENSLFADIFREPGLTGLERMRLFFKRYLSDPKYRTVYCAVNPESGNSPVIVKEMRDALGVLAPCVRRIIDEGNADSSLNVTHPEQAAEALCLLVHIWLNPRIVAASPEELWSRACFLGKCLDSLGVPLADESMKSLFDGLRTDAMAAVV